MDLKNLTAEQLVKAAAECSRPIEMLERNFAANVIVLTENPGATPHFAEIAANGERLLLQFAFLSMGHNPTSNFIMSAYDAGWRDRGGLHRQ